MIRLESRDSSGGFNTREEPRALAANECMELVNAFPGSPSPTPRPGTTFWGRNRDGTTMSRSGDLLEIIPFKAAPTSFVLEVTTTGVFAIDESGFKSHVVQMVGGGVVPGPAAGSTVVAVRVDSSIIANSDDPSWRWIFDLKNDVITARSTNIARPTSSIAISEVTTAKLAAGWYRYAYTFVNRKSSLPNTVYDPGVMESSEPSGKRSTVHTDGNAFSVTVTWSATVDKQVTHVRIYRTDAAISEDTLDALSLHWVIDLPLVGGSATFTDNIAVSEGDYLVETTDLSELPPASVMKYHNGRLWIGSKDGFFYYSTPFASSSMSAMKSLTFFDLANDFIKMSSTSTESATAIGVGKNDIYLCTETSVGYVQDGDPVTNKRQVISSTLGCPFPRTMCEWDQIAAWISPIGPVYAQNGYIDKMVAFKAGQVWRNPHPYTGKGFFHDPAKVNPKEVIAFRSMGTWWVSGGGVVVGFHESEDKRISGALSIEFAESSIRIDRAAVLDEDTVVGDRLARAYWTEGSNIYPWRFMNKEAKTDLGYFFTMRQTFRRLFVSKDPAQFAEPFSIILYANYTDNGETGIFLRGDALRFNSKWAYKERGHGSLQQHQDDSSGTRFTIEQPIPAGRRASFFDVGWSKVYRAPFDFQCWGCAVKAIERPWTRADSVSLADAEEITLDRGMAVAESGDTIAG